MGKIDYPKILVIKIGTSSVTCKNGNIDKININKIVSQISYLKEKGTKVILVSSGAIKVGMGKLGIVERPKDIPHLQACCATGQSYLMEAYNDIFENYGLNASQILLTADDFRNRKNYLNLRNTINVLLEIGCVPIVNENDTISTDETKVGENDTLSALLASEINADLLINLSDVNGLYTSDPAKDKNAIKINVVEKLTNDIMSLGGISSSNVGSGGMASKLKAAKIVTDSGTRLIIANAKEKNVIIRCVEGENVGTTFLEKQNNLTGKKSWIAYAAKTKGTISVNVNAKVKLVEGKSLLAVGIVGVDGDFSISDIVGIECNGEIFAKGISYYSSEDIRKIQGLKTSEIENILDMDYEEVIHHNNMVIL